MARTPMLSFLSRCTNLQGRLTPLADFWSLDEHDLPDTGGAYVLVANHWFVYPRGKSPVFYIGQTSKLRERLTQHLNNARGARGKRRHDMYWPRYEYARRFGSKYCYVQTHRGMTSRSVEEELLASFARSYMAFPVANAAGSWNRIAKHFGGLVAR